MVQSFPRAPDVFALLKELAAATTDQPPTPPLSQGQSADLVPIDQAPVPIMASQVTEP